MVIIIGRILCYLPARHKAVNCTTYRRMYGIAHKEFSADRHLHLFNNNFNTENAVFFNIFGAVISEHIIGICRFIFAISN